MKQIIVTALAAIMAAGAIQAQARDREEAIVTKITDGAINLSRFSSGHFDGTRMRQVTSRGIGEVPSWVLHQKHES